MSLLGKLLAVLNIFGAIAFVAVGFMDYAKRETWAYANFVHDAAVNGLPLDDKELDAHESPLKDKLAKSTQTEWFGAGNEVAAQLDEVARVKKAVDDKIAALGGDPLNETVEYARILAPFAQHDDEREHLIAVRTYLAAPEDAAKLNKRLHNAFAPAVQAYQTRPDDLKFPQAFADACRAEGPPPARRLEEIFLGQLASKPEKTFEGAVAEAKKVPANPAAPDQEAHDRALAFLRFLRDDPGATLRKPADNPAGVKDTLDDVFQATLAAAHDQLKAQLDALFDAAQTGPKSLDPASTERLRDYQRAAIAHLLFNLIEYLQEDAPGQGVVGSPAYARFTSVVGLTAAVQEINDQATVLQRLGEELKAARDLERGAFADEHRALIDQLRQRAVALHDANDLLTRKTQQLADEDQDVRKRRDDVKNDEAELADSRTKTEAAIAKLRQKSDGLHDLRIQDRDVLGENLELEKQIRQLEQKH